MQFRVVNQVSTSPPCWECWDSTLTQHLLQDAEMPQSPLQYPTGSGCRRGFGLQSV